MAQTDLNRVKAIADRLRTAAVKHGIPPALMAALASRESGRVNVLDANGVLIEEGTPDNGLFFVGTTEGWQEVSLPMPVTGQKVILEFEFVDGGGSLGAGFFIDDVLLKGDD